MSGENDIMPSDNEYSDYLQYEEDIVYEVEGDDGVHDDASSALESMGYDGDGGDEIDRTSEEADDYGIRSGWLGTALRAGPIVVVCGIFLVFLVLELL